MNKIDLPIAVSVLNQTAPSPPPGKTAASAATPVTPSVPPESASSSQGSTTEKSRSRATAEMLGAPSAAALAASARKPIPTEPPAHKLDSKIGEPSQGNRGPAIKHGIIGRDDRAHHLALNPVFSSPHLPPARIGQTSALPSVAKTSRVANDKPRSRFECEGRCGANGFCDPYNERGCGGIYCGRRREKLV